MLRKEASTRLNDPSGSIFILEMSDCIVVSLVAMVVDGDFDPLGDLRRREEDKCLRVVQYDDPRKVMLMRSKLLNGIKWQLSIAQIKTVTTNLLHELDEVHPSRCIFKM